MTSFKRSLILAIVGLVLMFFNPLTQLAAGYNQEIALGGTAIYASLRGLSSVMSIVRDADVQASIGVASIATSPGQALQPVIGTVERMANLLFALVVVSGVLGFTLPIVSSLGALVLALGAGARALAIGLRKPLVGSMDRFIRSAVALGIFAAGCLPMAYAVAFFLGDHYTADAWNRAADVFERQAESLSVEEVAGPNVSVAPELIPESPLQDATPQDGNILDWAKGTVDAAVRGSSEAVQEALGATTGFATAVRDQVEASALVVTDGLEMAAELFQASVDIGVAYLVKLIVLPSLILAGIIWLFQSFSRSDAIALDESRGLLSIRENDDFKSKPETK